MQDTDVTTEPIEWAHKEVLRNVFTKMQNTMETLEVYGQRRAERIYSPQARIKAKRDLEAVARATVVEKAKQAKKATNKAAREAAKYAATNAANKAAKEEKVKPRLRTRSKVFCQLPV